MFTSKLSIGRCVYSSLVDQSQIDRLLDGRLTTHCVVPWLPRQTVWLNINGPVVLSPKVQHLTWSMNGETTWCVVPMNNRLDRALWQSTWGIVPRLPGSASSSRGWETASCDQMEIIYSRELPVFPHGLAEDFCWIGPASDVISLKSILKFSRINPIFWSWLPKFHLMDLTRGLNRQHRRPVFSLPTW